MSADNSANRNVDAVSGSQGTSGGFHASVERAEPMTTHGVSLHPLQRLRRRMSLRHLPGHHAEPSTTAPARPYHL